MQHSEEQERLHGKEAQTVATDMDTKESLVTKADLLALELKVAEKFSHMEKIHLVFFVIIVAAVLLTNPKALDIISKLLGMAK